MRIYYLYALHLLQYNLDDEKLDSNQLNYINPSVGNYDNHWSTTFTVDTCSG